MTTEAVRSGQSDRLSTAKQRLLEQRLRGRAVAVPDRPEIPRRAGNGPTVLSPVQHGMWLANELLTDGHRKATDNSVYGVQWTMWLRGALDRAALAAALDAVVSRHEVLRSTYPAGEDGPSQVVGEVPTELLRVERPHNRAEALALAEELTHEPFDLNTGPLFGSLLVPLSEYEHLLLVRADHLMFD